MSYCNLVYNHYIIQNRYENSLQKKLYGLINSIIYTYTIDDQNKLRLSTYGLELRLWIIESGVMCAKLRRPGYLLHVILYYTVYLNFVIIEHYF